VRRINLLPTAQRRQAAGLAERVQFLTNLPPKTWTAVITALAVVITLGMTYSVASQKSSVERGIRTSEAQLDSLRPVVIEVEDLRRLKAVLDDKMEVVDRLVIGRMSWARKLHELADLMSRNDEIARSVWLTRMGLVDRRETEERAETKTASDGKKTTTTARVTVIYRALELEGILPVQVSTGMVSDLMRLMKEDQAFFKDFTKVQLDYIQDAPAAQRGAAGKAFKVSLYMKPSGSRG
jgi:hypothetical protein